jgi:hypothetical protein
LKEHRITTQVGHAHLHHPPQRELAALPNILDTPKQTL